MEGGLIPAASLAAALAAIVMAVCSVGDAYEADSADGTARHLITTFCWVLAATFALCPVSDFLAALLA